MIGGPISTTTRPRYKYINYSEDNYPALTIGIFFRETGNNFIVGFSMPHIDISASKYFIQVEHESNLQPGTIVSVGGLSNSGDAYLCNIADLTNLPNTNASIHDYAIIAYGIEAKNPTSNLGLFTRPGVKRYLAVKIDKNAGFYLLGAPIFINSKGVLMPIGDITEFNGNNANHKNIYVYPINTAQSIVFGEPQAQNNIQPVDIGDIVGFNKFYNAFIVKFN